MPNLVVAGSQGVIPHDVCPPIPIVICIRDDQGTCKGVVSLMDEVHIQAVWEAEELKAQLLETQSRLSEVEARAEKEATQRAEAERQLQAERELTAQLQARPLSPRSFSSPVPNHQIVMTFIERSLRGAHVHMKGGCITLAYSVACIG